MHLIFSEACSSPERSAMEALYLFLAKKKLNLTDGAVQLRHYLTYRLLVYTMVRC